jgi:hypothetical protein
MGANSNGSNNSAFGYFTLANNTTGGENTAIGLDAMGGNSTGSKNTVLGADANVGAPNLISATAIGARSRVDCSYCLVLGTVAGVYSAPSDANVGIGTTSPDAPLTFGNNLGKKIVFFGSGTSSQYGIGIVGGLMQIHSDAAAADIAFGYGSSASFTERMRIKGNGNVGIGTTAPTRPLSFPAALGEKILLYPGGAGEVGIGVYGNELRLHADNPGASVSFGTQDNAGVFTQAGRFQLSGGYGLFVNGNILANGITINSDERFKQNITIIESPLEKILQINGVQYEMRVDEFSQKHFMPGRQMGLLAQNVEKVVPEVVNEIDGYKGVDYSKLIPLLIEGMKEQQKQIEELKKKVQELSKNGDLSK